MVGSSTDTIEMEAEYTTPTCSGLLGVEVHTDFTTHECGYHFTGTASKTAVASLVCEKDEEGNPVGSVTITPTLFGSSACTIHVPAANNQNLGGHVTFKNLGDGTVTAEATVSGITSEVTNDSFGACGGTGHHDTGTYTGNVIITGYEDLDGEHGNQVSINVT